MSIINDALKKVQAKLEKNKKNTAEQSSGPPAAPEPKKEFDHFPAQQSTPQGESTPETAPWVSPPEPQPSNETPSQPPQTEPTSHTGAKSFAIGFFAMLCLIGAVYLLYNFDPKSSKIVQQAPEPVKDAIESIPVEKIREKLPEPKAIVPVIPKSAPPPQIAYKPSSPKGLTLNGIMTIEGRHVALINNVIYEEGDTLNGDTVVTSISLDGVQLKKGSRILELKPSK